MSGGMRLEVLRQVAATTFREFVRSKEAVFWTYGFPILMAVVLGLAFSSSGREPVRVAVVQSESAASLLAVLEGDEWLVVQTVEQDEAQRALAHRDVDLVLAGTPQQPAIWRDDNRDRSELAYLTVTRALERAAGRGDELEAELHAADAEVERYIDFLLPGLIGLNLLGAGMWGVGFNLVQMRIKNLLRRLIVAPVAKAELILAFLISRLGLVMFDAFAILGFGALVFGVPVHGSWLLLAGLFVLSSLAFSALGLVVSSRARTVEGVSGLMNLVMLPQWVMAGVFFKTTYMPDYFRPFINVLPLTHVNDAMRAIMLDGAGLSTIWPQVVFLAVFTVIGFGVALRIFRWT